MRLAVAVFAIGLAGCAALKGVPAVDNPMVEHYRRIAENVAFPVEGKQEELPESQSMGEGRPLVDPKDEELRAISLREAVQIAIQNNKILRQNAQFLSPQNPILQNPDGVPSVFDPDIQNTGVLFGSRGTAAALSDFDPKLSSSFTAGRDANGQNSIFQPGALLTNDNGQAQFQLDQQLLSGGTVSLLHNWTYSDSNTFNRLFGTTYVGQMGVQFQQPLWSGFGREVTSIAGPTTQQARGFSFVNQGIVIARLNNRIAEIDFEENLQNLLREIGEEYWDLFQSYREVEAEKANVDAAKQMWDDVQGKAQAGLIGEAEEAQAEDAYHEATARKDQALAQLLQHETRLRRLLGLPIEDGKLLHPSDEPQFLEIQPKRAICLFEALTNRIELRRQKTNIRSLELQLTAAKNLANPSLNFVAGYSLNGFGNKLLTGGTSDGITMEGFNNAYASLLRGKETSWNMGLQYTVPLWLRSARAQVQQLEYRILKARTGLAAQEDEIGRELQSVMQTMQHSHALLQTNRRRFVAAQRRVDAAKSEFGIAGRIAFDAVLRAEISLTQAEVAYYRSLGEYNKSLRNLMYRMGRLSSVDGIELMDSDGLPLHPKSDPNSDPMPEGAPPPSPAPPEPVIPRRRPPQKPRVVADVPNESSTTRMLYEVESPWTDAPEMIDGFVVPISGRSHDADLPRPLSSSLIAKPTRNEYLK